jgi:uncharacterized protein (DUF305 family)
LEVELVLFSRDFIRKRVISLATTTSVAAISFVSAQDTTKTHHIRRGIQHVADRQAEQALASESAAATRRIIVDMTIKPIRDIDRDLVEMRVLRHQGAVEMARERSNGAVTSGFAGNRRSNGAVLPQSGPIGGSVDHGGMNRL